MYRVFFGPGTGIWKCLFMDVVESPDYDYCDFYDKTKTRLKEIVLSHKIQRVLPHYLKRFVYRKILKYRFLYLPRSTNMLFLFTNGFEMYGDSYFFDFITFLKKEFKGSKYAMHYYESLSHCYPEAIPWMKQNFDLLLSFDHFDYQRYGIEYYPPVCEKGFITPTGLGEKSDVFYVGGKSHPLSGRIDIVLNTFKYLSDNGKVCIFFMPGISEEKRKEMSIKINADYVCIDKDFFLSYKKSKFFFSYIPYSRSLSYLLNTKAVLEVVKRDVISCTARLAQAMVFERKLITTSSTSRLEPYYDPNNILSFEKPEDIDMAFFDTPFHPVNFDFSGIKLLKFMEDRLSEFNK